jgi:dolichol kinase
MINVVKNIQDAKKKINSLDFDVHWYRRVFHAFGASFVFYYMLPDIDWINLMKFWVPLIIVVIAISLEVLRLTGKISGNHFFGLRMYEQKRIGSYLFFAVAVLILLRFFPQQIAIPCILCACLADPIMGELRHRFGKKEVYIVGFLVCMLFFMVTWYKADIRLMMLVSVVGAFGAVVGETKKFWWLDDDFMIQMVPAILILIVWIGIPELGLNYPDPIIYPGVMPW